MSQPTVTALQRLRKVMGYVKGTPEYAVMLEEPEAGQGKWKTTNDAFWILESASDSDWPSNREHRRSTSSGVHLVNGLLMFASSRTQKIVSLSSCEAELHAMVSTLADGIYIKRCLEFVTGSQVFHCLMTGLIKCSTTMCKARCRKTAPCIWEDPMDTATCSGR